MKLIVGLTTASGNVFGIPVEQDGPPKIEFPFTKFTDGTIVASANIVYIKDFKTKREGVRDESEDE